MGRLRMPKSKKNRLARNLRRAGLGEQYIDSIKTTYGLPRESLPDFSNTEDTLAAEFRRTFPEITEQWSQVVMLYRVQMEKRAVLKDSSDLRVALDLLGTKAFSDARGAQLLVERGYTLASLGPLRAASEATDLMHYFIKCPTDVVSWFSENTKFDNLAWVRRELPANPEPFYEFVNWSMHANSRFITPFLSREASPLSTHYEITPGPVRNGLTGAFSAVALYQSLRVLGLLHRHQPDQVSQLWAGQLRSCMDRNAELNSKVLSEAQEVLAMKKNFADALMASEQET